MKKWFLSVLEINFFVSMSLLLVITLMTTRGYGNQEVDLRGIIVGGAGSSSEKQLKYWDEGLNLFYSGTTHIGGDFQFLSLAQFDLYTLAASEKTPLRYINHRQNEIVYVGLEYNNLVDVQLRNFYHLLNKSEQIGFPVEYRVSEVNESPNIYLNGSMHQRYKTGGDLLLSIPIFDATAKADILYNVLNYDYSDYGMSLTDQTDADLWIDASLGYKFLDDQIGVFVRGLQKEDLNTYKGYNVTKLSAGLSTALSLNRRKILLNGELSARHYDSKAMWLKGYIGKDKGYGIESHLRGVWQVARMTYLKGDAVVELSSIVNKTRYELSIRKFLKNNTSFDGGYWISQGGLVPRMCGYVRSDLELIPRLGILPSLKYYWLWYGNHQNSYSFYRADLELDLEYALVSNKDISPRNISCQCGALYRLYDKKYDISISKLQMFFGIKMNI